MMPGQLHDRDLQVWSQLLHGHEAYSLATRAFFAEGVDRVAILRRELRGGTHKYLAYKMLRELSVPEIELLFEDLVFLASAAHGAIQTVRDAILSLPREWVLARIEAIAEPLLVEGDYDTYRRLLELYVDLDRDLALDLAQRAARHSDDDVREAGHDFLERLTASTS